jgi:hypothetical protein
MAEHNKSNRKQQEVHIHNLTYNKLHYQNAMNIGSYT